MLNHPHDHSASPQPDTSPAEDPTSPSDPTAAPSGVGSPPNPEADPLRQLFGRHSNHLDRSQTRNLRSSLRQRMFAGAETTR